jgi:hypothetical protein
LIAVLTTAPFCAIMLPIVPLQPYTSLAPPSLLPA